MMVVAAFGRAIRGNAAATARAEAAELFHGKVILVADVFSGSFGDTTLSCPGVCVTHVSKLLRLRKQAFHGIAPEAVQADNPGAAGSVTQSTSTSAPKASA